MMKISVVKGKKQYVDKLNGLVGRYPHRGDDLTKKNFICEVSIQGEPLDIARNALSQILAALGLDQSSTLSYALGSSAYYDSENKVYTENILFPRDLNGDFAPMNKQEKDFLDRVRKSAWVIRRSAQ